MTDKLQSETLKFAEAVKRSKTLILSGLSKEMDKVASGEFMATSIGVRMLRHKTAELLAWAGTEAAGFDALRLGIAHALQHGEELPPDASLWLVQYLRGEVTRPKAQAGRKHEQHLHSLIWIAVTMRVAEGMKATRNDVSQPTSACDAVAQALSELGLEPTTFFAVKRIWQRFEGKKGTTIETT